MSRSKPLPEAIAVFDSGVWFSAIRFNGIPLEALNIAFLRGQIVTSAYIRSETERNLAHKHQWNILDVRRIMNRYVRNAHDIYVPGHLNGMCRDRKDDQILECAVVAGAQILVTGDKDLLEIRAYQDFVILKPRDYLHRFDGSEGS
jgi:putative PIN family toxin of toxin-antitoxin system